MNGKTSAITTKDPLKIKIEEAKKKTKIIQIITKTKITTMKKNCYLFVYVFCVMGVHRVVVKIVHAEVGSILEIRVFLSDFSNPPK